MTTLAPAPAAGPLELFPWTESAFKIVRAEQGGRYVTAVCPIGNHKQAGLRLWVKGDRLLLGCYGNCSKLEILRAVGASWKDCFLDGQAPEKVRQETTAVYPYVDERGDLLYQTVRLEPGRGGRDKDFRQRRPDPADPRKWAWSLGDARRVLYRLPDLLAADRRTPVVVAAGEKDVESLRAVGVLATTNVCGEHAAWEPSYSLALAGRPVVVVADADGPGRRHADEVVGSLVRHGAAAVWPVELPAKDSTAILNALRRRGVSDPAALRREFWRAVRNGGPRWCPVPTGVS